MRSRTKKLIGIALVQLALVAGAEAASFECAKATASAEKFVCENATISKLDETLDALYRETLAKASAEDKQALLTQQRHWLTHTRDGCRKEVCFKHAYWMREAELAAFFEPKSPRYAKESDKAEPIRKILATTSLQEAGLSDPQLCKQMFADLKNMKNIRFVEPLLQAMSYEDPVLEPWRKRFERKGGIGAPLGFSYPCWNTHLSGDDVDSEMEDCSAYYRHPPYKLYVLTTPGSSKETRYIFYSGGGYRANPKWESREPKLLETAEFIELGRKRSHLVSSSDLYGPVYNGVIEYRQRYFVLNLEPSAVETHYSLNIELTDANASCTWRSPN